MTTKQTPPPSRKPLFRIKELNDGLYVNTFSHSFVATSFIDQSRIYSNRIEADNDCKHINRVCNPYNVYYVEPFYDKSPSTAQTEPQPETYHIMVSNNKGQNTGLVKETSSGRLIFTRVDSLAKTYNSKAEAEHILPYLFTKYPAYGFCVEPTEIPADPVNAESKSKEAVKELLACIVLWIDSLRESGTKATPGIGNAVNDLSLDDKIKNLANSLRTKDKSRAEHLGMLNDLLKTGDDDLQTQNPAPIEPPITAAQASEIVNQRKITKDVNRRIVVISQMIEDAAKLGDDICSVLRQSTPENAHDIAVWQSIRKHFEENKFKVKESGSLIVFSW